MIACSPIFANFNSLAPCGANLCTSCTLADVLPFQLTRPVWGEPCHCLLLYTKTEFQLTRPVWGEPIFSDFGDSIYAFQLTRPVWGEPSCRYRPGNGQPISTHSPRVGRTGDIECPLQLRQNFNSLAPCGANLFAPSACSSGQKFQLTRPVWGEPLRRIRTFTT